MHQLLKERYTREDIYGLIRRGQAEPVSYEALRPVSIEIADILNKEYEGNVDIKAIDHKHSPPVHLWARVDGKDGVPWSINVTYLRENPAISLSEKDLMALARKAGLATSENWPLFYLGRMHPLASFWQDRKVLQISFLNMPPERVIAFLKKVEERLI